ncbi:MAG: hypothetical protein JSW58_14925 [Candidatus Latescibacterota bacterium]|nr:MAG: hypothetical protein JSW58_14925 [Candidatus Latescibacterota bacterium]
MCSIRYAILLSGAVFFSLFYTATAFSRTWYIQVDGSGDVPTIQTAIDSANPGDEILVAPGRYTWANQGGCDFGLLFFPRDVGGFTLRSEAGPDVTILDAQGQGRVAFVQGYNNITIEGFTITGGNAPAYGDYIGGGICVHISEDDIIRDCVFINNTADIGAGFWATSRCNTRVENCTFVGNHARRFSGGVGVGYSQDLVTITGCTVINNTADEYGAGMIALRSTVLVENTVFAGNQAGISGGGLYASDTEVATFTGTTFSENGAPEGGGVYVDGVSVLSINQSIIAFSSEGGGLVVDPAAPVTLGCTDVFGNEGGDDWPTWVIDTGGNFSADPLFCGSPGSWDYTLRANSPCLPGLHPGGLDCGLIGARTVGCSGVPVKPVTWGSVKMLYLR